MICEKCNFEIPGGKIFQKHLAYCDGSGPRSAKVRRVGGQSWSKGLSKDTDVSMAKISNALTGIKYLNRLPQSQETKNQISESMKKAHSEGRAHNIGSSRWNNEPSYPEKFFMEVIKNEFQDKNYSREFSFGKFSLDFAWVEKKLCIEIDGEQHKRFKEYRERDERKDKALHDAGWNILRIEWKEMFNNTKYWIEIAKTFIDSQNSI